MEGSSVGVGTSCEQWERCAWERGGTRREGLELGETKTWRWARIGYWQWR